MSGANVSKPLRCGCGRSRRTALVVDHRFARCSTTCRAALRTLRVRAWAGDRVPAGAGPVSHRGRGADDVALLLVRGALRPAQRRVREPGRAQRRAAAAGHGVRRPPAHRSRDRHLGAQRGAAAHLDGGLGGDRAGSGAAPLRGRRGGALRGRRRRGDDAVPAGVGTAGRVGSRARLRPRRGGVHRRMDLRGRRRGAAASYPSRRVAPRCTSPSSARGGRLALPESPQLHVFVARGRVLLGERTLAPGDAARMLDEGGRDVVAEEDSQLVVWGFAPRGSAPRG